MAEFEDTDVNIQEDQGRTALHWACELQFSVMIKLCLSVPECDVRLRDCDRLAAFDLAQDETAKDLFYRSILEMEDTAPQDSLLRVLALTSMPTDAEKPVFPGAALFGPVTQRNRRLMTTLIDRGVDLTARDEHSDTALHVAAAQSDTKEITTILVEVGAEIHTRGKGGATQLHSAVRGGQLDVVKLLLDNGAVIGVENGCGVTALQMAKDKGNEDLVSLLESAVPICQEPGLVIIVERPEALLPLVDTKRQCSVVTTSLANAIIKEDLGAVRGLLERGGGIHGDNYGSYTLLHIALCIGNIAILMTLIHR